MNLQEHRERHKLLHEHLDELLADYLCQNPQPISNLRIMTLLEWSHKESLNPTPTKKGNGKIHG